MCVKKKTCVLNLCEMKLSKLSSMLFINVVWFSSSHFDINIDQGPVVESIVSLTMSLRHQLVKYMLTTLSNTLLFVSEKCKNLLHLTFFQQKITLYL